MLKQAYRHKNQQQAFVPQLSPGPSLIATNAFVLFVAGFHCGRFDVGGSKCLDLHISLSFLIRG